MLQGVPAADTTVTAFKGVPFAAAPVGELRWKEPKPAASWKGVRKADKFSANCIQVMHGPMGPWTAEFQPYGPTNEDCLYLNIWTAAKSPKERRVVAVHFHGGGFRDGSGNVPLYDGEHLAKKGIVLVTVNYRVGVMGFFAHPELTKESAHKASGNYGLMDQVAALEWIKKNISAFGGDPEKVTIMGQSAGAASVHYLTASPQAKQLFVRAIAQSGSNVHQGPGESLEAAEKNGVKFAEALGAKSLADLRAIPAEKVLEAVGEKFRFNPIVDGWFLPKRVDEIFAAGEQNDVAMLTGWDADEGSLSDDYGKVPAEEFRDRVKQRAGADADEVMKLYPMATQAETGESEKALLRDMNVVGMYVWATNRAKTSKTPVYMYLFTHEQPGPARERYHAFHSSELAYVFNNLDKAPRPWTAEDRKIAETMSDYWVNFVSTGNPNGKGLPEWPAFDSSKPVTMELGDRMGPRPVTSREKLELLEKAVGR